MNKLKTVKLIQTGVPGRVPADQAAEAVSSGIYCYTTKSYWRRYQRENKPGYFHNKTEPKESVLTRNQKIKRLIYIDDRNENRIRRAKWLRKNKK